MSHRLVATLLSAAVISTIPLSIAHADEGDSPTVAIVNGETITEIERDTQSEQFKARGQNATDEQVVDELVSLELMRQQAIELGLDKSPAMAAEMKIMHARVLANALLTDFTSKIDTSDEALKAEYEKQIALAEAKEFNASHILLEDEEKAKEIIAELDGGADFAEAAKKYSTGPSGPNGGDLGWFDAGSMVPEFSQAVAAMETGKHSTAPVKTQFGFHIIKLVDTRSKEPQPFEALKDQIGNMILRTKVEEYVRTLHDAATIERL